MKKNDSPKIPVVDRMVFCRPEFKAWYSPIMLGPEAIGSWAIHPYSLRKVLKILDLLEADDYINFLKSYYDEGLKRFGRLWRYADILSVLYAVSSILRPVSYLEIGVRRGRSMAMVGANCPHCHLVGFDLWEGVYAGIPNPGPDFVRNELKKTGYFGEMELIKGDSHITVPDYFKKKDDYFDVITVDGDHSEKGAKQDLVTVLPRLKIGGIIVFDDICHPSHSYLDRVWDRVVGRDPRFLSWKFSELGYGIAMAIRRN